MNIKITPAKNAPLSFGWNFPFKLLIWKWVELHRSSLTNLGTRCCTEAVDSWTSYKKSHPGLTPSPCMESELDWGLDIHSKFALFKKVFLKIEFHNKNSTITLARRLKLLRPVFCWGSKLLRPGFQASRPDFRRSRWHDCIQISWKKDLYTIYNHKIAFCPSSLPFPPSSQIC